MLYYSNIKYLILDNSARYDRVVCTALNCTALITNPAPQKAPIP